MKGASSHAVHANIYALATMRDIHGSAAPVAIQNKEVNQCLEGLV